MTYVKKAKSMRELKRRVDGYFESRLAPALDKNGVPLVDENGQVIKRVALPYTLTGLALAVGCNSREELFTFKNKEMDRYIRTAVLRVEEYAEERLFSKEAFSGVKLFLAVNFDRWRDGTDSVDEGDYELPEGVRGWTV